MAHRFHVSVSVLIGIAVLAANPLAGQQPRPAGTNGAAAKAYKAPRTPDGQPDLQGFWTNSTYTPLERPDGVTKEFYTPEEYAKIEKAAAERESEQTEPGTVADVHYDFTQFGLDRSQGTWAPNLRTSLIVDPPDGKIPPADRRGTEAGSRSRRGEKGPGRSATTPFRTCRSARRCIIMAGSGPPLMSSGYNANYQFVQAPGQAMILTEMIHDARIIPLDGRPQPPQNVRQWVGLSRGRWEGETLVVETTNFNGKNPFRGSSENLRVVERFTRVADDIIIYRFTVEDPATWTKPWTVEERLQKTMGPIFEHACHEGNYDIANTLSGARAEEKRAAEEAARKSHHDGDEMKTIPCGCRRRPAPGRGARRGASLVFGGVRCDQAAEAGRNAPEMGDDQSPFVVPSRRERPRRHRRHLDGRRREPESVDPDGRDEEHRADRHDSPRGRLSGQGRHAQGGGPEFRVARRFEAVSRRVRPRRRSGRSEALRLGLSLEPT